MTWWQLAQIKLKMPFRSLMHEKDLFSCYVPFDRLLGNNETDQVLLEQVLAGGRIAIAGPPGSGKSSVLARLELAYSKEIAPLRIGIVTASQQVLSDRGRFVQQAIQEVVRLGLQVNLAKKKDANRALKAANLHISVPGSVKTKTFGLGTVLKSFTPSVGYQRQEAGEGVDMDRALAALDAALDEIIEHVRKRAKNRRLTLIIHDTDRLLVRQFAPLDVACVFFDEVVRSLLYSDVAIVFSVDSSCLREPLLNQSLRRFADSVVELRKLESENSLRCVLEGHLVACGVEATLEEVFTPQSVSALMSIYAKNGSFLDLMDSARQALDNAVKAKSDRIKAAHIEPPVEQSAAS